MALTAAFIVQILQMALVVAVAPLLTGYIRKVKARLVRRRGAPIIQPYRDLLRLMRKEVIIPDTASWLFRFVPHLVLGSIWAAAALVPTFFAGLLFTSSPDL